MSRVGRKNPYDFIRKNYTRTLTNELGQKYSWLGQKQKRKGGCPFPYGRWPPRVPRWNLCHLIELY